MNDVTSAASPALNGSGTPPPITVGVPVYNGEKYMRIALDALLKQTFTDFEMIIGDNASTDKTQAICEEYAKRDPRIRYVRNPENIGANANYHYLFSLARGRYFLWNSVDDYIAPAYLERCKAVLDSDPGAVLCCARVSAIDEAGNIIEQLNDPQELAHESPSERFKQKFRQDSRNNTVYALIRSDAMRKTRVVANYLGSDNVLMEHLALYGRFREVPEYLFFRRTHPGAFTYASTIERFRQYYAPSSTGAGGRFALVATRHFFEYVRVVFSTPLPVAEKTLLWMFLLRQVWWQKSVILKEVLTMLSARFRGAA